VGHDRAVDSIIDDDGQYTDIQSILAGRVGGRTSLDADRLSTGEPTGSDENEAVRRPERGYEGLDPSVVQPRTPHHYSGLAAAAAAHEDTEQFEMSHIYDGHHQQNTVRYCQRLIITHGFSNSRTVFTVLRMKTFLNKKPSCR